MCEGTRPKEEKNYYKGQLMPTDRRDSEDAVASGCKTLVEVHISQTIIRSWRRRGIEIVQLFRRKLSSKLGTPSVFSGVRN